MKSKIIFCIWLALMVLVHVWTEYTIAQTKSFEITIAEILYLGILTFPLGLLIPLLWTLIMALLGQSTIGLFLQDGHVGGFVTWISFVAIGYWQWFVIVPKLYFRFNKWRESRSR